MEAAERGQNIIKSGMCKIQQSWSSLTGGANKCNTIKSGAYNSWQKLTGESPLRQTAGILDSVLFLHA